MDLHDFETAELYFEEPELEEVNSLLAFASISYGGPEAEQALDRAAELAPESLSVVVARFRYYYYQHELSKARETGEHGAKIAAMRLGFRVVDAPSRDEFEASFRKHPGMARFYLQSLKGIAYLNLRLGNVGDARVLLERVSEFDPADRMGCRVLMQFVTETPREVTAAAQSYS